MYCADANWIQQAQLQDQCQAFPSTKFSVDVLFDFIKSCRRFVMHSTSNFSNSFLGPPRSAHDAAFDSNSIAQWFQVLVGLVTNENLCYLQHIPSPPGVQKVSNHNFSREYTRFLCSHSVVAKAVKVTRIRSLGLSHRCSGITGLERKATLGHAQESACLPACVT